MMGGALARVLLAAALGTAVLAGVPAAAQDPASPRSWSSDTALTMPRGRVELGAFHPVHWAVTDDLELAAHPVLEILLPHLEAKARWLSRRRVSIATWHRLSYPSLLLATLSREGTAGLLPANTDVPVAIALDTSFLITVSAWDDRSHFTLDLGVSFAPRLVRGGPLVLDFPFLYSRFAAVSTTGTTHAGLSVTGVVFEEVAWRIELVLNTVPVVPHGFVLEQASSLTWHPSTGFGIGLGYRLAHGRYPVGLRTHVLPTFDVLFAF